MSWWNPLSWFGSTDEKTGEPVVIPEGLDRLTGGDAELRAGMVRLEAYAKSIVAAIDALNELPPEDQPGVVADVQGWKNSVRNRILAGSGDKAAFFGTISTEPVVTAQDLADLGIDGQVAVDLIAERDRLRAAALDVSPLGTAPAPKE
jgi:hypothetical protein